MDFYYDYSMTHGKVKHTCKSRRLNIKLRGEPIAKRITKSRKMHCNEKLFCNGLTDGKIMLRFNQNLLQMDKWLWFGVFI